MPYTYMYNIKWSRLSDFSLNCFFIIWYSCTAFLLLLSKHALPVLEWISDQENCHTVWYRYFSEVLRWPLTCHLAYSLFCIYYHWLRSLFSIRRNMLTGGNWQKWKRVFLTCPCHKIYRDEAVGLKSWKNTWKITIFVKM